MENNDYMNLENGLDFAKIDREVVHYSTQGKCLPIVKILRRILWRLVRPFHYYQISAMYNLYQKNKDLTQICEQIQNQIQSKANYGIQDQIYQYVQSQSQSISFYETEYIALVNRTIYLEKELELLKSKFCQGLGNER